MHNAALHFMLPDGVGSGMLDGWSSFPSDHAVLFSGLAVAVWIQSWRGGLLFAIWALVVVCLPRVYLGYRYPTDLAAEIGRASRWASVWQHGEVSIVAVALKKKK